MGLERPVYPSVCFELEEEAIDESCEWFESAMFCDSLGGKQNAHSSSVRAFPLPRMNGWRFAKHVFILANSFSFPLFVAAGVGRFVSLRVHSTPTTSGVCNIVCLIVATKTIVSSLRGGRRGLSHLKCDLHSFAYKREFCTGAVVGWRTSWIF